MAGHCAGIAETEVDILQPVDIGEASTGRKVDE